VGVVKDVKVIEGTRMLLFHFPKTHIKFDEWVAVGSSRIQPVNTKSVDKSADNLEKKHKSSPHSFSPALNLETGAWIPSSVTTHFSPHSSAVAVGGKRNSSVSNSDCALSAPQKNVISNGSQSELEAMTRRYALLQSEGNSVVGGVSQSLDYAQNSLVSTTENERFCLHDFSNNDQESPSVNQIFGGGNWDKTNTSKCSFYRQLDLKQPNRGPPNYSPVVSYGLTYNNNGQHFHSNPQFVSLEDNVYMNPATPGDICNTNHGLASFDKLLLLASASHGQATQQINAQLPHTQQLGNGNGINYQVQQSQYTYQHQTPQSDRSWAEWTNQGNR
jgi:hypothetical protein